MATHSALLMLLLLSPVAALQMNKAEEAEDKPKVRPIEETMEKQRKEIEKGMVVMQDRLQKQITEPVKDFQKTMRETQLQAKKSADNFKVALKDNFQRQQDAVTNPALAGGLSAGAHTAQLAQGAGAVALTAAQHMDKQYRAATEPAKVFVNTAKAHTERLNNASSAYVDALKDRFQKQASAASAGMNDPAQQQKILTDSSKNLRKAAHNYMVAQDAAATQPLEAYKNAVDKTQKEADKSQQVMQAFWNDIKDKAEQAQVQPAMDFVKTHQKAQQVLTKSSEKLQQELENSLKKQQDMLTKPVGSFAKSHQQHFDELKKLGGHHAAGIAKAMDMRKMYKSGHGKGQQFAWAAKNQMQHQKDLLKKNVAEMREHIAKPDPAAAAIGTMRKFKGKKVFLPATMPNQEHHHLHHLREKDMTDMGFLPAGH